MTPPFHHVENFSVLAYNCLDIDCQESNSYSFGRLTYPPGASDGGALDDLEHSNGGVARRLQGTS